MKKLLLLVFSAIFMSSNAQNATLAKSYTIPSIVSYNNFRSIVYGSSLFNLYGQGFELAIQKSDLNGVPVVVKLASVNLNSISSVHGYNGNLYVCGDRTSTSGSVTVKRPFLLKIDTANCAVIFHTEYQVGNFSNASVQQSKMMSNGDMMMAGSLTNFGPTTAQHGFFLRVSTTGTASSINSNTVTLGTGTINTVHSFAEISNSSLLFIINAGMGKASKTANTITFGQGYMINGISFDKLENYSSNLKKIILHSNSNPNFSVCKIDTAVNLGGISARTFTVNNTSAASIFLNERLYKITKSRIEIIDTTLTSVFTNTYSTPWAFLGGVQIITHNANNLFVNSTDAQTSNTFHLLKTDLFGMMNCSTQQPPSTGNVTGGIQLSSLAGGTIQTTDVPVTYSIQTTSPTYTNMCSSVSLAELHKATEVKIYYSNGSHKIELPTPVSSVELFDLTGRSVRKETFSGNKNLVSVDLNGEAHGIYIARIIDSEKKEYKVKVLN